ncbi:MAG: ACP S-malonyltransferase [Bdellovibrionales bacterium]|nr:ACP S-malonyltransferase [Bdellovibrionales bacterium]
MWAALFPGQGSQKIGMGSFYYEQFQTARRLFESASDELKINFKKLCFEGPEEELTLTQNAQPAIVLVSCTAWFCLEEEMDLSFIKYCAGHSVGEYSALVAAGVLPLNSALKAVRKRGLYMSECGSPGQGGMSALVGPSPKEAKSFCLWVEKESGHTPLETANFNSPEQTVLSGSSLALNWAKENYQKYSFSSAKIRLIPLKVSAPFHSSLMEPACEKMKAFLNTLSFKQPNKMIVQNTVAKNVSQLEILKDNLMEQVKAPVLWLPSIQYLIEQGCHSFLELGEGKVLSGLMKKTDSSKTVSHFHNLDDIQKLRNLTY